MLNLKIDNVNGQVVYKDEEGWKFYCNTKDIDRMKKSNFDGEFEFPELQNDIPELTKEEYAEISENEISEKIIPIYNHNLGEWVNYTFDEMEECFNFVEKPDYSKIEDIHFHNVGFQNKWIEISFKNGNSKVYNNVFGTYVEQ